MGTLFYTPKVAYVSESPAANSKILVHDGHLAPHLSLYRCILASRPMIMVATYLIILVGTISQMLDALIHLTGSSRWSTVMVLNIFHLNRNSHNENEFML